MFARLGHAIHLGANNIRNRALMPEISLYGNRFSGHSYKVRLYLTLTKTPHVYKTVDLLQSRADRQVDFRERARFGEVPLLIINGQPYAQSNAILLRLQKSLGITCAEQEQQNIVEWLMWEQGRLGSSLPNLRFERLFNSQTKQDVQAWLEERLRNDLDVLNAHLSGTSGFVVGMGLTIADCSLAGYLYWLSDAGLDIDNWPKVQAWLQRISELDGWQHPDKLMA